MNPLDLYSSIQELVKKDAGLVAGQVYDEKGTRYGVADVPIHTHNGVDSAKIDFQNLNSKVRYLLYRIIDSATSVTATTSVGGDFVMPFSGGILDMGVTVDTAGTTGTMTVDINLNGTTLMTTQKVSIATTVKTSRSNANQPIITTKTFAKGDILTFDNDAVQTTPAKGETVFLVVQED